jgi:hypothetical protein
VQYMSLRLSDSTSSTIAAVNDGDCSTRSGDGLLDGALTFRRVPDRRQIVDRRAAPRGGRRAAERVPAERAGYSVDTLRL